MKLFSQRTALARPRDDGAQGWTVDVYDQRGAYITSLDASDIGREPFSEARAAALALAYNQSYGLGGL